MKKLAKKLKLPTLLILIAVFVVLLLGWYVRQLSVESLCEIDRDLSLTTIYAEGRNVVAEVARNEEDKARGLSGRKCLGKDRGMLFAYDTPADYRFWMKDMRFPIDIIWLDDEKTIVTVSHRVAPDTYPRNFGPDKPAQYILEVNAGVAERNNWKVGTKLEFGL